MKNLSKEVIGAVPRMLLITPGGLSYRVPCVIPVDPGIGGRGGSSAFSNE